MDLPEGRVQPVQDSIEKVPRIRRIRSSVKKKKKKRSSVAWKRAEDNSQTLQRDTADAGYCLQRNNQ